MFADIESCRLITVQLWKISEDKQETVSSWASYQKVDTLAGRLATWLHS